MISSIYKSLKFLIVFLIPFCANAQIPDPLPNTYVNDLSGKLSDGQIHELNDSILAIEKRSSVQIAVILLDKLPDNIAIEDYAMQVGRKWHVGNANNGLVYVAAISDRKQRLEVANNLQGDIPDLYAHDITENIKPYFKNYDYFGGLKEMLSAINTRVDPAKKEQLRLAEIEKGNKRKILMHNVGTFFLWFAGIGLLAFAVWYFIFRPRYLKRKTEVEAAEKKLEEVRKATQKKLDDDNRQKWKEYNDSHPKPATVIAPIIVSDIQPAQASHDSSPDNDSYKSSNSSNNSSSDYGNWGSGSSGSSDSGFSGGGSSNDW